MVNHRLSSGALLYAVIRVIRPLYRHLVSAVEANLSDTAMSVAVRGLLESLHEGGPATVPTLARRLLLARQFALRLANDAIEAGFAEQRPNPGHRRSPFIALTAEGERALARVRKREQAVIDAIAAGLSRKDIESALRVLEHLEHAFRKPAGGSDDDTE